MAGFLDDITEFFLGFLSGDPQAARLRKRLKELAHSIAEFRPVVFSKSNDTLFPALPIAWFQMYQLLAPLSDLFSKTIGNADRKIAEMSLHWLIESVLEGSIPDRRVDLNYQSLQARFAAATNVDQEAVQVGQEFTALLSDVRRQDSEKWQQDFSGLFRLRYLAAHNYIPFFKKFGYDLASIGSKAPRFNACDADDVLPELIDLYYLLGNLDFGPGVEWLLGLLLEKISPAKASENRQKVGKLLEKMRDLLRGPCSSGLTINLIRLIKKDPDDVPDTLVIKDRYIADYATSLSERFAADRERALRERNESGLEKDIKALFQDTHLLETPHYSAATNEKLSSVGLPSLTWVKPLQILRSFAYSVLKTHYLGAVKMVVLNGFFNDKEWQHQLGNDLAAAEKLAGTLEAFDESLAEEGKATLVSLEKYLTGQVAPSALARQLVDKINHNASAVLESQVRVLNSLSLRVHDILSDYKSPQPNHVTNIKGLGGKDQREMIESLLSGYNKSAQVLKILKNFVILKG